MKIIHLSDLHVGYKSSSGRYNTTDGLKKIISYLIDLKIPHSKYTVVITGDLVDDATDRKNYDTALGLIKDLKKHFRVLLIPGNHDYGTGVLADAKFVSLFKEYFFDDPNVTYPKIDVVENILFIGLDSMAEEVHWYDGMFANGEIGKEQLGRLAGILNDDKYGRMIKVVYLHHHPFHPTFLHELKDSKVLCEIIAGKVDALLFGHNHAGDNFNGGRGLSIPRCYDGGSSTRKLNSVAAIRVFDPDPKRDTRNDYIMDIITETDIER
jgi:3',5'-cyclic AMP phosphodiesterase CpdA